ncbi:hypothetical protein PFICI_07865 [Pestalotiopsis fici W106-1]|uniref:Uncharacterized protein n=1 Tax=Pestalotiopsis fici (strain W106-1 / CGMCC3.15140) TaxID=1229662 RepID=W3X579_PESFW|nr:uncharacterized protein PFICI_07865 [Pestalotiopsis fici W106-1]ETS80336.1 hypothetical protein PFICI_07865 [Pestalotiopsis fici W106-1]
MKFLAPFTLAIASLTTASPIEPRAVTNFDGSQGVRLNLVNASFGPDGGLYYKGMGLAQIYDKGKSLQAVQAHSNPNVLTYGDLDRLSDPYPYITSKFTGSSGTFDLESFYYGCVLGNKPGNCVITVVGFRNGVKVAAASFSYEPVATIPAPMAQLRLTSAFRDIDSVRFTTVFSDSASHPGLGGATFLDDLRYTYFGSS